jgi:hypothetical protein
MSAEKKFKSIISLQNKINALLEDLRAELADTLGPSAGAFLTNQAGDGWCICYDVQRVGLGGCSGNSPITPSGLASLLKLDPARALEVLERNSI